MTEELRARLTQTLGKYCDLADGRNELLHNPIGRSVESQVYIMLRIPTPVHGELPYQIKPISPPEIDELSAKIKSVVLDLRDLQDGISKARFAL